MKLKFACPNCGKPHAVDATFGGKKGRCKDCGTVMRIPAPPRPLEARAATAASTSVPTGSRQAAPRARAPEPVAEVDDPYGLADEPSPARAPLPPRQGPHVEVEPDSAPLRRAGGSNSGKPKRKKKGRDDGPWGAPLRTGAIGLMGLVLLLGRGMRMARRAHQEETIGAQIVVIAQVLCLLAAVLSIISVVGAAIDLARGNRSAFGGEKGALFAWFLSVVASVGMSFMIVRNYQGSTRVVLSGLDSSLASSETLFLHSYERLVDRVLDYHGRYATALQTLPPPDAAGQEAWRRLGDFEQEAEDMRREVEATPLPTADQVRQLFARYKEPVREAVAASTQAAREARDRLQIPSNSEFSKAAADLVAVHEQYANEYDRLYPKGGRDSTGWYFFVFGATAGAQTANPPKLPAGLERPRPDPTQPPPELQREMERMQREAEQWRRELQSNPGGPRFGPGGPPVGPGGP